MLNSWFPVYAINVGNGQDSQKRAPNYSCKLFWNELRFLEREGFKVLALTVVVSPANDLIFQVIDNQLV